MPIQGQSLTIDKLTFYSWPSTTTALKRNHQQKRSRKTKKRTVRTCIKMHSKCLETLLRCKNLCLSYKTPCCNSQSPPSGSTTDIRLYERFRSSRRTCQCQAASALGTWETEVVTESVEASQKPLQTPKANLVSPVEGKMDAKALCQIIPRKAWEAYFAFLLGNISKNWSSLRTCQQSGNVFWNHTIKLDKALK